MKKTTNETEVSKCFQNLGKILRQKDIQMITVRECLKKNREALLKLAISSLTYECINVEEGKHSKELNYYIGEDYKKYVLESLSDDQLVNVVLNRPTYTLRYVPRNTFVEPVNISFRPLGNLLFVRDQQITTQKGVIFGRTLTWAREMEHSIMKQVFQNLNVEVIGEIPEGAYLEGGDFFVAKTDLAMVGIGIRTNMKAAAFLMENDLLGTDRFALVVDETDLDQQRMHLDTFFNILSEDKVVVLDFEELSKIEGRHINRKVFVYDKNGVQMPEIVSQMGHLDINYEVGKGNSTDDSKKVGFKNIYESKYGQYKLSQVYDDFNTFLKDEKYSLVKISNKQQEDYMINFLNIGNNTVISVNEDLKNVVNNRNVIESNGKPEKDVNVVNLDFNAVIKMYGAVHCATQVSRKSC